jgi:hypothetical protein
VPGRIGLLIVVTKLNKVVLASLLERLLPCAFINKALRASSVQSQINTSNVLRESGAEPRTVFVLAPPLAKLMHSTLS